MESISEVPPDGGAINGLNLSTSWTDTTNNGNNNSNILYIAVEYVKENEFKLDPEPNYAEFDQHVSPLDPNMSSVARYSPVYTSENTYENPVVVTQLVEDNVEHTETPLVENNNLQQTISNRFLQLVNQEIKTELEIVPPNGTEQEVELLITDQTTGISYLVERCLSDDNQLLDQLSTDTLLDSDLLALDEASLKTQLSEIIIEDPMLTADTKDSGDLVSVNGKVERRSQRQLQAVSENEENILSCVQQICDKPILSRARASLPESYLLINRNDLGENGIFARKFIPKRTQFGPIEGFLDGVEHIKIDVDTVQLSIESEDGTFQRLDTSDENNANWMCFVRLAQTYAEQNLVLTQQDNMLFYTTIKNIVPKQELLVGYGLSYANQRNLNVLEPLIEEEDMWPCYECSERFISSQLLHKHLDHHDAMNSDPCISTRKKAKRKVPGPSVNVNTLAQEICENEALQCTVCLEVFDSPKFGPLRQHLVDHGLDPCEQLQDRFIIAKTYNCEECDTIFVNADDLKKHTTERHALEPEEALDDSLDDPLEDDLRMIKREIVEEVESPTKTEHKCPVCYKSFASGERIQRHMLVHGSEDSKPLKCDKCSKRFLNNSALTCHLKTHLHGRKVFECPICKDSFHHVLQLKMHVPKHSVEGKYTCPHCNKVFHKYSIIRKHIRAFHCERKHTCPDCNKPFPTLDKLRMHLLRHSDHREFLCADCGKQFKRKDKLKEHCKRMHNEERENNVPRSANKNQSGGGGAGGQEMDRSGLKRFTPKVQPTDYHRFIYKCHTCLVGFKRRGMLVNHLAKRHPDISPESVPELNLPILRATKDYYCNYCDKVYKSSSKRKAHILKNHPGSALPLSNRRHDGTKTELPNPTFSQTVGSVTTHPQACQWCHKQYASKAKLLQHQRKKHTDMIDTEKGAGLADELAEDGASVPLDDLIVHQDGNYYQLVSMDEQPYAGSTDDLVTTGAGANAGNDSRLYRFLTTGNNLVPPR